MNQCVPGWDLDDPAADAASGGLINNTASETAAHHHRAAGASPLVVPMADQYYEVAELTWEKGNISSHGLLNRPAAAAPTTAKQQQQQYPPAASSSSHHLHAIGGGPGGGGDRETLEAVVGEAAARSSHFPHPTTVLAAAAPWLLGMPADALVPCAATATSTRRDADDEALRRKRARVDGFVCAASQGSAAPGPGPQGDSAAMMPDVFTTTTTNNSTSLHLDDDDNRGSPDTENTSIGGGASDSRCFSRRSQRDGLCDEEENVIINGEPGMRSSISTKRSRAAAIHNESERKRRDRINQKMKTLQKLVPNSSKTDKASMLDEVIDYLKQLQAQVQLMSRMSSMMMPMGMAMPQLQMSVMAQLAQMAQMAQMAQGMMNMGSFAQPGYVPQPMMHPPPPFIPLPWSEAGAAGPSSAAAGPMADRAAQPGGSAMPDAFAAFLACQQAQAQNGQQQQGSMEAYNRMLAMCQKLNQQQQQSQPSTSKQ